MVKTTVRTISMDSTDGLVEVAEVVGQVFLSKCHWCSVYGRLFNVIGDAIDGLGNLPKTEAECQFTVKHLNLRIYQLLLKFYSQVLK
jgi:F0F1-type ATP synthase beta subunit